VFPAVEEINAGMSAALCNERHGSCLGRRVEPAAVPDGRLCHLMTSARTRCLFDGEYVSRPADVLGVVVTVWFGPCRVGGGGRGAWWYLSFLYGGIHLLHEQPVVGRAARR